jgi:hypothetical protein
MAEVENVSFPTRKEHGGVREEIDTVETYSESARGCGVEALVTAGDVADSREVILIPCLDLPEEAKRRVVADEEGRCMTDSNCRWASVGCIRTSRVAALRLLGERRRTMLWAGTLRSRLPLRSTMAGTGGWGLPRE